MRYGKIEDGFWEWAKRNGLSTEAIVLAVYVLSCPHANSIGCYRLPMAYLTEDLGWPAETVSETLSEVVATGFIERDDATGWTRIVGFLDHNPIANANVGKAAAKFVSAVPVEVAFYAAFLAELKPFQERFPKGFIDGLENRFKRRAETLSRDSKTQEQEHKHKQEQKHISADSADDGFSGWSKVYPKRVARPAALRAYRAALKKADAATLLAGAQRVAEAVKAGKDLQYVPNPATWLNQERWLDDGEAGASRAGARTYPPTPDEIDWDMVCSTYKKVGHWFDWAGNRPGLPGCKCPPEFLARHGITEPAAAGTA